MSGDFSVQDMSVSEKLDAMEKLWESLRSQPDDLSSPDWHHAVLADRERRLRDGEATVASLEDVRKRLEKLGQ
ncbi:MAG: addiction module protein [Pirellulaceae bacterium]|nr:addiction module protein [Pirellulaceae bacterium]